MKKDIKFSTRMASEDREAIKELAKRSGMSMSDYVTACCLGKQVVVVANLQPVKLRGELSEGMVLAASTCEEPRQVVVVSPSIQIDPGSRVK